MKNSLLVLSSLTLVSAWPQAQNEFAKRQTPLPPAIAGLIAQMQSPYEPTTPVKFTESVSDVKEGAKKVVVSYGPFTIPPSKVCSSIAIQSLDAND
jgi:hypothetical protein